MNEYQKISYIKNNREGFDVILGKKTDGSSNSYATWLKKDNENFLYHFFSDYYEALRDMLIRADKANHLKMEEFIIRADEFDAVQNALNCALSKSEAEEFLNDEKFIEKSVKLIREKMSTQTSVNIYEIISSMVDKELEGNLA